MSRAMLRRLAKLEAIRCPAHPTLVVIPWDQWPEADDEASWDRIRAAHPEGRIFTPSQAESVEAWEGQE